MDLILIATYKMYLMMKQYQSKQTKTNRVLKANKK